MAEYNLLTQRLLSEGYTVDHYPDYVQIQSSTLPGDDPLNNLGGGFIFKRAVANECIYKTGCGKYVLGENVNSDMSYMGILWCHENDNPVIRCPYDIPDCPDNDPRLHGTRGGGLCIMCQCVCHKTEESYDYENSIEKADDERQTEKQRKYREYSIAHKGRICLNHMLFDERTREWRLDYEPQRCARICYSQDGWCPVLDRQLSRKKGNVYYDLKTSHTRKDGTLFDGEVVVHIEKGIRYFERPVCMDICEAFIRQNGKNIIWDKYKWNTYTTVKLFDPTFQAEILNIRAESRPSRDLMQDLADIQDGIRISHSSDLIKRQKEAKRERRQKTRKKRIEKLEAKILEIGYDSLEEHSLDKIHADKWLTPERIEELAKLRQQRIRAEQEQPVQINLFDLEGRS